MRSLLPLLFASVSLIGCFGSHGRGRHDPPDSGPGMPPGADAGVDTGIPAWGTCNCCGTTVAVAPGESCLSGVCDPYCGRPPPRCPLSPITLACGFEPILAGTPTTLPVQMGNGEGCFCGETIECQVADLGAGRISLQTGMCTDGPLCDACLPFIYGACELPALAAGRYQVDVNGAPGFELDVVSSAGEAPRLPETSRLCLTAVTRSDGCGPAWPARPSAPTRVCHARATDGRVPVPIEIVNGCASCGAFGGPCEVEVSGRTVHVRPSELLTDCDIICDADFCPPRTDVCWTPPLDPGSYDIVVESMPALTSTIEIFEPGLFPGPEEEVCLEAFTGR